MSFGFRHYLELIRLHFKRLVLFVGAATAAAALVSIALLVAKPRYVATASVVMLPTSAEIDFARQLSEGSSSQDTLADMHIEYIQSRPVVENLLGRITAGGADEEPPSIVAEAVQAILTPIKRLIFYINWGTYEEPDPAVQRIDKVRKGIEIEKVAGSLILQISVTLDNPNAAAVAANTLADAYLQRASDQLDSAAGQLESFLQQQIVSQEQELNELLREEYSLTNQLGFMSLDEDREFLLRAIEDERQKSVDASVEMQAVLSQLEALRLDRQRAKRDLLAADLDERISQAESQVAALRKTQQLRQESIENLRGQLNDMLANERPVLAVKHRREAAEGVLSGLRDKLLEVSLSRSSALSSLRIIDPAVPPIYPSSPQVILNTILGFFAGSFLALFGLVVIDLFSSTVRTSAELEAIAGSRSIGAIRGGDLEDEDAVARVASDLQRSLAVAADADMSSLGITGFTDRADVEALATALRNSLGASASPPLAAALEGSTGEETGGSSGPIQVLPPLSTGYPLERAAANCSVVLCMLPAAELDAEFVTSLLDRAAELDIELLLLLRQA